MQEHSTEKKKKKGKAFWRIVFILSILIIIVCAFILIKMYMPAENDVSQFKNETTTQETQEQTQEETTVPLADNPIDFESLQEGNPDIYAWITIPNTLVDYPVLQSDGDTSDSYYLDHNMYNEYDVYGAIYSQKMTSTDFTDFVSVIYGHNMKNKSMFGSLHYFEDAEFFEENEFFYVYTPGHILTYQIVSAYNYDNRHILNTFDFHQEEDRLEYIDSILNPTSMVSNVREGIELSEDDNILTLSTCNGNSSQRYLVQGVLYDDELTN